jgi:hypothetical protein
MFDESVDHLQSRGLPTPGLTEEDEQLTLGDVEVHSTDGVNAPVVIGLGNVLQ